MSPNPSSNGSTLKVDLRVQLSTRKRWEEHAKAVGCPFNPETTKHLHLRPLKNKAFHNQIAESDKNDSIGLFMPVMIPGCSIEGVQSSLSLQISVEAALHSPQTTLADLPLFTTPTHLTFIQNAESDVSNEILFKADDPESVWKTCVGRLREIETAGPTPMIALNKRPLVAPPGYTLLEDLPSMSETHFSWCGKATKRGLTGMFGDPESVSITLRGTMRFIALKREEPPVQHSTA